MSKEVAYDVKDSQVASLLRKVAAFGKLTDKEIKALAKVLKKSELESGETVFNEGDFGTCAFIVVDGELSLDRWGHTIKRFVRGDLFGEIALIDDRPRTGTVRALTKAALLCLEGRD